MAIAEARRCRGAARFTDSDSDARDEQVREVTGESGNCRGQRPERRTDGNDGDAVSALGNAGDGNAQRRVEHRESQAAQQPHAGIGDMQLGLDGLYEYLDDDPVHEAEGRDQGEEK